MMNEAVTALAAHEHAPQSYIYDFHADLVDPNRVVGFRCACGAAVYGCANCGHDVDKHDGTGPCPLDDCQSFVDRAEG